MRNVFDDSRRAAALVAPALAIMGFAIVAPILVSLFFSLTDWMGFGAWNFVRLDNYRTIILDDPVFWRSLLNALILMGSTIFIQHPAAFVVSIGLSRISASLSRSLRTILFIPSILTVVVTTKLWVYIYNPRYGLLSKFLRLIGQGELASRAWLSDPDTALGAVVFIMLWQGFGWAVLFYYSAIMTMPKELEEAATVDGASSFQVYSRIVIPYLMPIINSIIIIAIIASLKAMETVFLATKGGPGDLTQFIANYLYRKAFVTNEFGYANAVSVLFVLIALGMTLVTNRLARSSGIEQ